MTESVLEYQEYGAMLFPLMEAKFKKLKKLLADKTKFTPGEVFLYTRDEKEFCITLAMREGSGVKEFVDFVLVDGTQKGAGVRLRVRMKDYGFVGSGVVFKESASLEGAFSTDVEELTKRIEELNLEDVAQFVQNVFLEDEALEPQGLKRVAMLLGVASFYLMFFPLLGISSSCPPLRRWLLEKLQRQVNVAAKA